MPAAPMALGGPLRWLPPAFIALTWAAIDWSSLGPVSPVDALGALLLLIALFSAVGRPELTWNVVLVCALLGLPIVATGLLSPEGPVSGFAPLRELMFLFITALCLFSVRDVERVAVGLAAVGAFLALGGIYSVLIGPIGEIGPINLFDVPRDPQTLDPQPGRAGGPFGEPNFFALALAAILPISIHLMTQGRARLALGAISATCLVGGILATGSRGGVVAAVFAIGASALALRQRAVVIALVALAIPAALVFLPQLASSVDRPVIGRLTENQVGFAMFLDRPLTGVGPATYEVLYRDYSRGIGWDPRSPREPHSLPIELAAEQGLTGLLAWLAAGAATVGYARPRGIGRHPLGRALVLAASTYLVGSLFLHGSQLRLLFMLIGLVLALAAALPQTDRRALIPAPHA